MTSILLLRHGQSTWNAEGRWQGWADAPLSELGMAQALEAAAHLDGLGITASASSDLERARHTAEIIATALGITPPVVDAGLRERDVGPFTGLTRDEIKRRWPEAFHPESGHVVSPPDGETDEHLLARVLPALTKMAASFDDQRVVVVSHGGVLRTLERHLTITPAAATPNLAGRWYEIAGDEIVPGAAVVPIEPEHVTTPRSL